MATVILRTGANRSNTEGPVAVFTTRKEAERVKRKIECFNGQHLSLVALSSLDSISRQSADELGIIEKLSCCGMELQRWELVETDGGAYLSTGKCQECWSGGNS